MTRHNRAPTSYLHTDNQAPIRDRTLWHWFLPFASPYRYWILTTFIAVLICEIVPFLFPGILRRIIDGPVARQDISGILPLISFYLGLVILHALLVFAKTYLSQKIGAGVIHDLRTHMFSHLQKQDVAFFQRTPAGRLITRMTHDVDTLQQLLTEGLIDLASSVLMLVFALAVMLYTDWRLAIATFIFLPGITWVTSMFRKRMRANNSALRQELAHLNSTLQENLNGMPLVRLFRKQAERLRIFRERNHTYRQTTHVQARLYSWFFPSIATLSEFSLLACYTAGIWLISAGELSLGTLAAFAWLASIFNRPVREISDKITNMQTALAAAERVYSLSRIHPELPAGTELLQPGTPDIHFDNVFFAYRDNQPVLAGVSFHARAGTATALVGSTGSGKSTIIHLINRFYLARAGSISIGNQDIRQLKAADLLQRMATVNQDVFLFAGTLRENILLGRAYQETHFMETCERTRVDMISRNLPKGYDTEIREGGKGLSMGERQLVSFARALYGNPDILLLDEATASIDTENEELIQQALQEVVRGRTAIIVAHRLSTIRNADQILVLQEGRIMEKGNHAELIAQQGLYHAMLK